MSRIKDEFSDDALKAAAVLLSAIMEDLARKDMPNRAFELALILSSLEGPEVEEKYHGDFDGIASIEVDTYNGGEGILGEYLLAGYKLKFPDGITEEHSLWEQEFIPLMVESSRIAVEKLKIYFIGPNLEAPPDRPDQMISLLEFYPTYKEALEEARESAELDGEPYGIWSVKTKSRRYIEHVEDVFPE